MGQITSKVFMIRPANFGYNEQTAENNYFQTKADESQSEGIKLQAVVEFDNMVQVLQSEGVHVDVFQDTQTPLKPDAVFPNNWISTHANGKIITYPMYSFNRRIERREDIVENLRLNFDVNEKISFEQNEAKGRILEGTGSMIFDRENKIAYACISERTDSELFEEFCESIGYTPVSFVALDKSGAPIYHTNVMMALGDQYVVICLECIVDAIEKGKVLDSLEKTGKTIVDITLDQVNAFAGNMLQLEGKNGSILVMSQTAFNSLEDSQIEVLSGYSKIVTPNIDTIEKYGGGSVRCMIAENFLNKKNN